jgi:tetratricopeptide (TPR) repeat protein
MDKPLHPPVLSELFAQYLQGQVAARGAGLGFGEPGGEVVPFDAMPAQPTDPRLAWHESLAVLTYLAPNSAGPALSAPPDWPALVAGQESVIALPFCLGNFPQLVRNLRPLLHATDFAALRAPAARSVASPAVVEWAQEKARDGSLPGRLLALGALRLARQLDTAAELVEEYRRKVPPEWQAAWANEAAALAWHAGRADEARRLWQEQAPAAPVLFNRGMAALFCNQPREARTSLGEAAAQLPESTGWHHLARLYLALAEAG